MSQIFADTGSTPAGDIETITGDDLIVVGPDGANNINILGAVSSDFNVLELQTVGDAGANTITVTQFNTLIGDTSGVGVSTINVITFDLGALPAAYIMDITMVVGDKTAVEVAGYNLFGTIKTDGISASLVGTPDKIINEEGNLMDGDADMIASGNNFILTYDVPAGASVNARGFVKYIKQDL